MMAQTGIRYQIFTLLSGLVGLQAYAVIFGVLFVCGLGVPIPEDITLLAAGFLSSNENISFTGAMIVGFVGVLVGDSLLFFMGRRYGRRVFTWPGLRRIFTPARIAMAEKRIQENGRTICFTARFLPGLRSPIFLTVGVMRVSFVTFIALDGFAALISVPVWIYLGHFFGSNLDQAFHVAKKLHLYILGAAIVLVALTVFRMMKANTREKKEALKDPSKSISMTSSVSPNKTELKH